MNIKKIIINSVSLAISAFFSVLAQPQIQSCAWGKVVIDGKTYTEDQMITPDSCEKWEFEKMSNPDTCPTKTQHGINYPKNGGISIADAKKIEESAEIIILSRGQTNSLITNEDLENMQGQNGTITNLKSKGKTVYTLSTPDAVAKYMELTTQGKKVAMLLHLTC